MKAKVSLVWKPCIVVQVGGQETIDDKEIWVAEEEYTFLKSGFRGMINRIHESGPSDSSEMDNVGWDRLETCLRGAFKEGAPNMTARERVQILRIFNALATQNINHKFELEDEHKTVAPCGDLECNGQPETCDECKVQYEALAHEFHNKLFGGNDDGES